MNNILFRQGVNMSKTSSKPSSKGPTRGQVYSRYKRERDAKSWCGVVVLGTKRDSRFRFGQSGNVVVVRALRKNADGSFRVPKGAQRSELKVENFLSKLHPTGAVLHDDLLEGPQNQI